LQGIITGQNIRNTEVGTIVFGVDRGFNFELHVVSNNITVITELQVTAVIELNGVMVVCAGSGDNRTFTSTIQVASIGELIIRDSPNSPNYQFKFEDPPAAPILSGVMAANKQFTKTGASVNVTWSTSRGADNYTVNVTPPIMPGQSSDFTTTDTSLLLMLVYNVNYTINITAKNCAGSNVNYTVLPLIFGEIKLVS
jgi:hypothetical protein